MPATAHTVPGPRRCQHVVEFGGRPARGRLDRGERVLGEARDRVGPSTRCRSGRSVPARARKPQRRRQRIHRDNISAAGRRRPDPASPEEGHQMKSMSRQAAHSLKRGRSGAVVFGLAALAAVAVPASASASADASRVVGHVYVNDNTKGTNTIGAFDRHADGTLTPEAGSPFAAGGAGTGSGLASQGALQLSADGRFLVAVDAGSNQISVLRVTDHGSLRLIRHGVVSSGGLLPDSIAFHGDLVYVANSGTGGSNYTGFRLGFNGRLFPIPGSTVALAANAAPGDVLFNGTGTKLVGTEVGTSLIDSFTVGFGGRLTAAPNSPFKAHDLGPFGSEFRP